MRILLDVDGVLADFVEETIRFFDHQYRREDITDFNIMKAWGVDQKEGWGKLQNHMAQKGVVGNLDVMSGAKEMVEGLKKLGEVIICTTPMKNCPWWFSEREEWLEKHFGIPATDVIFTHRKELVNGDILIDDAAHNVEAWMKEARHDEDRVAIIFDAPWNQKCLNSKPMIKNVSGEHLIESHTIRCFSPEEVVLAVEKSIEVFGLS